MLSLDFELVRALYGELRDVEVGTVVVVAQIPGYVFGNEIPAIEAGVDMAIECSNMNDFLAQRVVFELGAMQQRALGIPVAVWAVGVVDGKFSPGGVMRVF
ncbi:MAG: hypothetical protein RL497_3109 [Pseudomonadota bacterium]